MLHVTMLQGVILNPCNIILIFRIDGGSEVGATSGDSASDDDTYENCDDENESESDSVGVHKA